MANPKVKRFFHPSYTRSEWIGQNPYLQKGEIGAELDGGVVTGLKVGPGNWNDLDYVTTNVYPFSETVTNEIGDVKVGESRANDSLAQIIRDMISPYVAPQVSGVLNDAAGANQTTAILKIGQSVDTSVFVSYSLNALGIPNLLPTNNISILSVDNIFSNEGLFTHSSGIEELLLNSSLAPSTLKTYKINVFAKGVNGDTPAASTLIKFQPEVLFGVSALTSLTPGEVAALVNRVTTDDYTRNYQFEAAGYHYIAIPQMLNPAGMVFTDITNPNNPVTMNFQFMQSYLNLNNGVGIYNYDLYRSAQQLLTAKNVRIS